MEDQTWPERPIYSRRRILALGGAAAAAAAILAACGSDEQQQRCHDGTRRRHRRLLRTPAAPDTAAPTPTETVAVRHHRADRGWSGNAAKFGGGGGDGTVKIGFTAPLTGPLAGFGEANPFILDGINKLTADGIMLGDKSYKVEIIQKDVESNTDTAASQAGELILDDGVDLMLAIATPEMINPVADQCEANGVPCLSTLAPWQPYFLGRGGDPAKGFDWTYHFFWGADQLVGVFADMWQTGRHQQDRRPAVPQRSRRQRPGRRPRPASRPVPRRPATRWSTRAASRTSPPTSAASSASSRTENVEIVTGIPIPPDFANFWTQAKQQGFKPKLVTMAKAVLFSSAVEALGDIGDGLASEVWWTPNHPFSSSLTGETSKQSGRRVRGIDRQAVDPVRRVRPRPVRGVLRRAVACRQHRQAGHRRCRRARRKLDTIVGPIEYGDNGLPKNISPTSLVGGQWKKTEWWQVPVRTARHQQLALTGDPDQRHVEAASLTSPCRYDGTAASRRRQQALRRVPGGRALHVRRCRGRGPRHRRAQRRGQDHLAQPDRR